MKITHSWSWNDNALFFTPTLSNMHLCFSNTEFGLTLQLIRKYFSQSFKLFKKKFDDVFRVKIYIPTMIWFSETKEPILSAYNNKIGFQNRKPICVVYIDNDFIVGIPTMFWSFIGIKMSFENRNNEKRRRGFSPRSISTAIEISKKMNELLEELGYNDGEMLLTKAHIQNNIMQLINSNNSNYENELDIVRKKHKSKISCNYHVDVRGRLIATYTK